MAFSATFMDKIERERKNAISWKILTLFCSFWYYILVFVKLQYPPPNFFKIWRFAQIPNYGNLHIAVVFPHNTIYGFRFVGRMGFIAQFAKRVADRARVSTCTILTFGKLNHTKKASPAITRETAFFGQLFLLMTRRTSALVVIPSRMSRKAFWRMDTKPFSGRFKTSSMALRPACS